MPLVVPHRRPAPLIAATFLDRPNRFLGIVRLADGREVEVHIGDRGRLEGLLHPGAEVFLSAADASPSRRTAFSLVCARAPSGVLVSIDPGNANRLVRALLEARLIDLPPYGAIAQEVRLGASRIDFRLELASRRRANEKEPSRAERELKGTPPAPRGRSLHGPGHLFLEVKSAGAAAGDVALFPDAPSERASRHCRELEELARSGSAAAIVLVAQRGDAKAVAPHPVDPAFAEALAKAEAAGVLLRGVAFTVEPDGFRYEGRIPVLLSPPADPRRGSAGTR